MSEKIATNACLEGTTAYSGRTAEIHTGKFKFAVSNNIHYILYILKGLAMLETMSLNVRISGELKEFVSREVQQGSYENISEYVRDLVRRDKTRAEEKEFERLKAKLQLAFSAPDSDYQELSVADIISG